MKRKPEIFVNENITSWAICLAAFTKPDEFHSLLASAAAEFQFYLARQSYRWRNWDLGNRGNFLHIRTGAWLTHWICKAISGLGGNYTLRYGVRILGESLSPHTIKGNL